MRGLKQNAKRDRGDFRRDGVHARGSERSFSSGAGSACSATGCCEQRRSHRARRDVASPARRGTSRVSPDGANVYVTMSSSALVVFRARPRRASRRFAVPRGATWSRAGGVPIVAAKRWKPTAIGVTPDGANLYVASAGTSTIHAFSRAGDGALALKAGSRASPPRAAVLPHVRRRAGHGSPAGPRRRGRHAVRRRRRAPKRRDRVHDRAGGGTRRASLNGGTACACTNRLGSGCAVGPGLPGATRSPSAAEALRRRPGRLDRHARP